MKTYVARFSVSPYDWWIYLFTDREKWIKFSARRTRTERAERAQDIAGAVTGISLSRIEAQECLIGVFDKQPGTLAHEAVHAATTILHSAGVKFPASNDEPLAYIVGYVVEKCTPALMREWQK